MLDKIKELLFNGLFPYVDIGIEYNAKLLGSIRKNLLLNSFKESEVTSIIITLLNLLKRGK